MKKPSIGSFNISLAQGEIEPCAKMPDPILLTSHQMKAMNYFRSLRAAKSGCSAGKFTSSTAIAISGNFLATSSLP